MASSPGSCRRYRSPGPNPGKALAIAADGTTFERLPIRTHLIAASDDIVDVARRYVAPHLRPDDVLFVSERAVAITQGRSFPIEEVRPSSLARFLVRFVRKTPFGIGIGSPWTMELALREAGRARVLLAAAAAAITKPLGMRGVFYLVCGHGVAAIDGPCPNTIRPYDRCATLGPREPGRVASRISEALGCGVVIVDANDLGVRVLGMAGTPMSRRLAVAVFRDNPLGQGRQRTPLCLVRTASENVPRAAAASTS